MEKLDSEYPTTAQMREMWAAYKTGDKQAMLAVLEKRRKEREEAKAAQAHKNAGTPERTDAS